MKITVTQDDIDKGESRNPFTCPIAIAASRVFTGKVRVGQIFIDIIDGLGEKRYRLPRIASEFIDGYDLEERQTPIEFEL